MSVITTSPNPQNPSEKEHTLPLIQFHALFLEDAFQAILHTLIFIRAPTQMKAQDHICTLLSPLMYSSCNQAAMAQSVQTVIQMIKSSLLDHQRRHNPIINTNNNTNTNNSNSPGLVPYRFDILVSFYEKKEVNQYFIMSKTEHIPFEHWRIPISMIEYPLSPSLSTTNNYQGGGLGMGSATDFQQQYQNAYNCVSRSIMALIEV